MILRKWEVRPLDKERAAAFAQTYGVPFFLAMLMNIRGLDDAAHLQEWGWTRCGVFVDHVSKATLTSVDGQAKVSCLLHN